MVELIKRNGIEVITFISVGVSATAIHYFAALILIEWFSLHVQTANLVGFSVAFVVSYLGQSIITFKSQPSWRNLMQYMALAGFNFGASVLILYLLTSVLNWHHRISLVVVVMVLPLLSYLVNKKVIFKKTLNRA